MSRLCGSLRTIHSPPGLLYYPRPLFSPYRSLHVGSLNIDLSPHGSFCILQIQIIQRPNTYTRTMPGSTAPNPDYHPPDWFIADEKFKLELLPAGCLEFFKSYTALSDDQVLPHILRIVSHSLIPPLLLPPPQPLLRFVTKFNLSLTTQRSVGKPGTFAHTLASESSTFSTRSSAKTPHTRISSRPSSLARSFSISAAALGKTCASSSPTELPRAISLAPTCSPNSSSSGTCCS